MNCGHCGRVMGDYAGGYAAVGDTKLCHPNEPGRPDCYRLVTAHGHKLNCKPCARAALAGVR
jgi:hypothetical protein